MGEWSHDESFEWHLLGQPLHSALQRWGGDSNGLYRAEPVLYERDTDPAGFEWIDFNDAESSAIRLLRKGASTDDQLLVVCNLHTRVSYRTIVWESRAGGTGRKC